MVEKEGERYFVVDLWRTYVHFTRGAFAIIDHVLLIPAGAGKTILWYAFTRVLRALALKVHIVEQLFYFRGGQPQPKQVGNHRTLSFRL